MFLRLFSFIFVFFSFSLADPITLEYPVKNQGQYKNSVAFAAYKNDGNIIMWGDPFEGGSFLTNKLSFDNNQTTFF